LAALLSGSWPVILSAAAKTESVTSVGAISPMPLSKKRQKEILRLAREGGDELTAAMALGAKETAKHLREIRREIAEFLKTCDD
jgi:hypothetical protein